jgi:tRNA wybutosine-synthesizing protein 1
MQLYVSVDAATKESLKAIDRPLFGDFWERFIVSSFLAKRSVAL